MTLPVICAPMPPAAQRLYSVSCRAFGRLVAGSANPSVIAGFSNRFGKVTPLTCRRRGVDKLIVDDEEEEEEADEEPDITGAEKKEENSGTADHKATPRARRM